MFVKTIYFQLMRGSSIIISCFYFDKNFVFTSVHLSVCASVCLLLLFANFCMCGRQMFVMGIDVCVSVGRFLSINKRKLVYFLV